MGSLVFRKETISRKAKDITPVEMATSIYEQLSHQANKRGKSQNEYIVLNANLNKALDVKDNASREDIIKAIAKGSVIPAGSEYIDSEKVKQVSINPVVPVLVRNRKTNKERIRFWFYKPIKKAE